MGHKDVNKGRYPRGYVAEKQQHIEEEERERDALQEGPHHEGSVGARSCPAWDVSSPISTLH